jgi:hypothetical protein
VIFALASDNLVADAHCEFRSMARAVPLQQGLLMMVSAIQWLIGILLEGLKVK